MTAEVRGTPMGRHRWDMPFGATCRDGGMTRFRLWAPGVPAVEIELEGGRLLPLAPVAGHWFEADIRCPPGTLYRFHAGGMVVPDPASRAQRDSVHGWSVVVDPLAHEWRHDAWRGRPWAEAVIYEAHAGVMGGFAGVRNALPRLARLGITAIELMPIADFSGRRNWGYDGVLPYAPASAYGTPEDLKALIDAAHGLGLMMMLDVVYNHFGPDGNYLPVYAPDVFRHDVATPWGPAIAFENPLVADFFVQNACYWLNEYRFDGLRLDAVQAITPYAALPALGDAIRTAVEPGRHVHLVVENERNDATLLPRPFDAQWNDDLHHCLHVLLTGEDDAYYRAYANAPAERLARCLSSGFACQGEVPAHLGHARGAPGGDLPPTAFVAFVQNHDQVGNRPFGDRLTRLAAPDALRAAVALVLLCPQIPMIFMGEEIGSRSPFLFFTDYRADLAAAVREGRRSEFRGFAAFRAEARRAEIPDPNDVGTFLASAPAPPDDGFGWEGFYGDLIAARMRHVVPRLPGARSLGARAMGEYAVFAAWRMGDGAILSLAANFGASDIVVDRPPGAELVAQTAPCSGGVVPPRATLAFLVPP